MSIIRKPLLFTIDPILVTQVFKLALQELSLHTASEKTKSADKAPKLASEKDG